MSQDFTFDSGISTGYQVQCPTNTVATGGGYITNSSYFSASSSGPNVPGSTAIGWTVIGSNSGPTSLTLTIYAICVPA